MCFIDESDPVVVLEFIHNHATMAVADGNARARLASLDNIARLTGRFLGRHVPDRPCPLCGLPNSDRAAGACDECRAAVGVCFDRPSE